MVATPGWTLDPQGRAMSKSRGNDIDPVDIANRLGGEIVRLWVASVDFREDVRASEELMQRVAENYRKIRNTFRFILGNLHDFDPVRQQVPFEQMNALDQYMLVEAAELVKVVRNWYEDFEFHRIYHRLNEFCTVDLSAVYFDVLKDRLYTFAPNSKGRRSGQTAIYRIGEALVRLVAPIMSFTAEEIWRFMPAVSGRPESVHLALFPSVTEVLGSSSKETERAVTARTDLLEQVQNDWGQLMAIREDVLRALEGARKDKMIGAPLEAKVVISAPAETAALLQRYLETLKALFIVSQIAVVGTSDGQGLSVRVVPAEGKKCERCWNYSTYVGQNLKYPTICDRCTATLEEIERNGDHA
jgi:isoleucyl-tRNA synthetase